MTRVELIKQYKKALHIAGEVDKLKCHVPIIEKAIQRLQNAMYIPTALDEVWVSYFLELNSPEKLDEERCWYFTCMDREYNSIASGQFEALIGCLEVYATVEEAKRHAYPMDNHLVVVHLPNRYVHVEDKLIGDIPYDIVNQLVFDNGVWKLPEKNDKEDNKDDEVEQVSDNYGKLIDLTYRAYAKKRDAIVRGIISEEDMNWLIDHLLLSEATDEELNEMWHAIDYYFRNLRMKKVNGFWKWRDEVSVEDMTWYSDCDSAWKEVVNYVVRMRRQQKDKKFDEGLLIRQLDERK